MSTMKKDIHPKTRMAEFVCACGAKFSGETTKNDDIVKIDICRICHPFFTGKQKIIDTAGRVDKFNKRYGAK